MRGAMIVAGIVFVGFTDAAAQAVAPAFPAKTPPKEVELAFKPDTPLADFLSLSAMMLPASIHFRQEEVAGLRVGDGLTHSIKPGEFAKFLDAELAIAGFEVVDLGFLLSVRKRPSAKSAAFDWCAPFVPEAELGRHAGLHRRISTVVRLSSLTSHDVKSACKAERRSGELQRLEMLSDGHIVGLSGDASTVCHAVARLRRLDGSLGPTPAAPPEVDRAIDLALGGIGTAPEAPDENAMEMQFDEVDGTPLGDFVQLANLTLTQPVALGADVSPELRLTILGALRFERAKFRPVIEAILKAEALDLCDIAGVLTVTRRPQDLIAADRVDALFESVTREQLDAERDGWRLVSHEIAPSFVDRSAAVDFLQSWCSGPSLVSVRLEPATGTVLLPVPGPIHVRGHARTTWQLVRMIEEVDRLTGPR